MTFVLQVNLHYLFLHVMASIFCARNVSVVSEQRLPGLCCDLTNLSLTGVYSCAVLLSNDVSHRSHLKVLCIEKQVKAFD